MLGIYFYLCCCFKLIVIFASQEPSRLEKSSLQEAFAGGLKLPTNFKCCIIQFSRPKLFPSSYKKVNNLKIFLNALLSLEVKKEKKNPTSVL